MLMSNQISIFAGLMLRTAGQILDAREAEVWVMDPRVEYIDEIASDLRIRAERVSGLCRPAGRCLHCRPDPGSCYPQPDFGPSGLRSR